MVVRDDFGWKNSSLRVVLGCRHLLVSLGSGGLRDPGHERAAVWALGPGRPVLRFIVLPHWPPISTSVKWARFLVLRIFVRNNEIMLVKGLAVIRPSRWPVFPS